jgi:DnaJ-domain-containing protein 1
MEIDPRRLLARLAAAVITADGRITTGELEALARLDNLGLGRLSGLVEEETRRSVEWPVDYGATCALLRERLPDAAPVIVAALAELAAADGELSEAELKLLGDAAARLGLAPAETHHILASVFGPSEPVAARAPEPSPEPQPQPAAPRVVRPDLARALGVLGLHAPAGRADLDASYRRLVERYDPARVIELGPDFVALAVRKLGEVTDAYQLAVDALGSQS